MTTERKLIDLARAAGQAEFSAGSRSHRGDGGEESLRLCLEADALYEQIEELADAQDAEIARLRADLDRLEGSA